MTQSCLVGGALSLAMDTPRLESLEMAEWGGERNCSGCGGGGGVITGKYRDSGCEAFLIIRARDLGLDMDSLGPGKTKDLLAPLPGLGHA